MLGWVELLELLIKFAPAHGFDPLLPLPPAHHHAPQEMNTRLQVGGAHGSIHHPPMPLYSRRFECAFEC